MDFFFIDRMLPVGGLIAFDDASWPSVRKVLRYIITNRHYSVVECSHSPTSRVEQLKSRLQPVSRLVPGILTPELINTDVSLGLRPLSGCIVLRKVEEDVRQIADHWAF